MPQTAPTKSNLNAAKRSRTLASTGYELMDRKRNILIRELMALIDDAKALQERIDTTFNEAYASMRIAEISMGGSARIAADSVPIDNGFSLRSKSVMGVELPYVADKAEHPDGRRTAWPSPARTLTTRTLSFRRSRSSSVSLHRPKTAYTAWLTP